MIEETGSSENQAGFQTCAQLESHQQAPELDFLSQALFLCLCKPNLITWDPGDCLRLLPAYL